MYKYYLLLRGRSIGTQPDGYVGWTDYTQRKEIPEIGRGAWGELYYKRQLTDKEVHDSDLYDAGAVSYVEYMDGYNDGNVEMRGVYGLSIGSGGGPVVRMVGRGMNMFVNNRGTINFNM